MTPIRLNRNTCKLEAFREILRLICRNKVHATLKGGVLRAYSRVLFLSFSALTYKNDPDLSRIKAESFLPPYHNSFSEVSNRVQRSTQMEGTRPPSHVRDPFLCARDLYMFPEQVAESMERRPPVLEAMAFRKQDTSVESNKLLVNQARNVCQVGNGRDTSESQCNLSMPSVLDAQLVDCCKAGFDLDFPQFHQERMASSSGLKNGIFKNDSSDSFLKESDYKKEGKDMMAFERYSGSRPRFSSAESPPNLTWSPRVVPSSRSCEPSAPQKPGNEQFTLRRHQPAFKKSGRPRLCQYLWELLQQPDKYSYMIDWIDKETGVFKFINSSEVARMWGRRRNKPSMKYDNFARSLRTYIAKGILLKPPSKLVYQFAK